MVLRKRFTSRGTIRWHLIAVLCLLVVTGSASSTSSGAGERVPPLESGAALQRFRLVADNQFLSLYIDEQTTEIAVVDKAAAHVWYSNPADRESAERLAAGRAKDALSSQITITYYTPGDLEKTMDSYTSSVLHGQYQITPVENGVRVSYTFGRAYAERDRLFYLIGRDRVDQIRERIDNNSLRKEFDDIFRHYTLISLVPRPGSERPKLPSIDTEKVFGDFHLVGVEKDLSSRQTTDMMRNLLNIIVAGRGYDRLDQIRYADLDYLRGTDTYILNERVPSFMLDGIVETLKKVGYTMDDKVLDCIAYGLEPPVPNLEVFQIPVEYVLDDYALVVRIPMEDVTYPAEVEDRAGKYGPKGRRVSFPLYSISLLPYFGAAGEGQKGYMLVPDGSGALIHLNNGKTWSQPYRSGVYGADNSLALVTERSGYFAQVYMPVFGLRQGDNAFLAVIEAGEANAFIKADVAGRNISYNTVSAEFVTTPRGRTGLSGDPRLAWRGDRGVRNEINIYQKDLYRGDIQIRYSFLSGAEADYSGMARLYQSYLVERGLRHRPSEGRGGSSLPFILELVGAISRQKPVLGLPREVVQPLTTFSEARDIIEKLRSAGIDDIALRYVGWLSGGVRHYYPDRVKLETALGETEDFLALRDYLRDHQIGFFPDVAFQNVYRDTVFDGFSASRNAARLLDRRYARIYEFRPSSFQIATETGARYVLSPSSLGPLIEAFLSDFRRYELDAISLKYMGNQVNSDFRENLDDLVKRQDSVDIIRDQLRRLAEEERLGIMVEGGNSLVLPYVDVIVRAPMDSSGYDICDRTVPFYQMVLHGYIDYAGQPLNLAESHRSSLLKSVETGACPYYALFYAPAETVKETTFDYLYSSNYEAWIDEAIDVYRRVEHALAGVRDKTIISHEAVEADVYKTVYEDGTVVVVNYGKHPVEVDGLRVGGEDFASMPGVH